MSERQTRVVFVSGLSGSGKSTAMAALEDLGFYCVDNLPPQLTEQFLDLCAKATAPIDKIALAIDAREAAFLAGFPGVVGKVRDDAHAAVVFLECSNEVLVNRYRETRRVHPLAPAGTVEEGIQRERHLLAEMAGIADFRVDTSRLNVHQLRETIVQLVAGEARPTVVSLVSFGYRFGIPYTVDMLFDVRFLRNPHFEARLREQTGRDPEAAEYVLKDERTVFLMRRLRELLDFLLPLYDEEGKAYLTIGIGCTGGRHRSVTLVEALAEALRSQGREVNVAHRDLEKAP